MPGLNAGPDSSLVPLASISVLQASKKSARDIQVIDFRARSCPGPRDRAPEWFW